MKWALPILTIAVSGCTFLPPTLAYLDYARTGYDITRIAEGEPTTTDSALSAVADMDCRLFNALDGVDVCVEMTQKWEP
jgi:hypothetical protein